MKPVLALLLLFNVLAYSREESVHNTAPTETQTREEADSSPKAQISNEEQKIKLIDLVSELFYVRKENATLHTESMLASIQSENEDTLVQKMAELVNSVDEKQKSDALIKINKELESIKGRAPELEEVLRRLKWAFEDKLNKKRTDSAVENKFKDLYAVADEKAVERARKFRSLVEKANQGDKAAREELLANYKNEELMDFIGSKLDTKDDDISSNVSKVLGWKDVNGNTQLDVKKEGVADKTWTLGKTNDEIRESLKTFKTNSHGLNGVTYDNSRRTTPREFVKADHGKVVAHDPKLIAPEDKEEICAPTNPAIVKSVNTKRVPGYFFRPFPKSNMGSYAADDHNYVLSLDNPAGSTEMIVPGSYDPVPTPDEMYMTIPSDNQSDPKKGITFFSMNKLLAGETQPLFVDTDFKGVYQSIGTRKQDAVSPVYRILTDYVLPEDKATGASDGLSIRDYKITRQRGDDANVQPQGKGPLRICSGKKFSLPMMSKDGKQFSALDLDDYKTKIFNIVEDANGVPTGECEVSMDLGMSTGKVDFNFNNDEITFHKFNYDPDEVKHGYNEVPSDDFVGNVYVYKRSTGVISRITNNTDSNAIYPAFRQDGKIVYINHPRRGEGYSGPSTLVIADPNQVPRFTFDYFPSDKDKSDTALTRMKQMAGLGQLWNKLCSPFSGISTIESSMLSPLSLTEAACTKMVDNYWDSIKTVVGGKQDKRIAGADLTKLTKDELKLNCPKPKENAVITHIDTDDGTNVRPRAPIPSSCRHCHSFQWDDPEWLKKAVTQSQANPGKPLIEEIIRRISITDINDPDRMPARNGGVQYLTDSEKNGLLNYLNKLKSER